MSLTNLNLGNILKSDELDGMSVIQGFEFIVRTNAPQQACSSGQLFMQGQELRQRQFPGSKS
jgi:hypothetical protein